MRYWSPPKQIDVVEVRWSTRPDGRQAVEVVGIPEARWLEMVPLYEVPRPLLDEDGQPRLPRVVLKPW